MVNMAYGLCMVPGLVYRLITHLMRMFCHTRACETRPPFLSTFSHSFGFYNTAKKLVSTLKTLPRNGVHNLTPIVIVV